MPVSPRGVRPSNVATGPEHLTGVDGDAVRLYELIAISFWAANRRPVLKYQY